MEVAEWAVDPCAILERHHFSNDLLAEGSSQEMAFRTLQRSAFCGVPRGLVNDPLVDDLKVQDFTLERCVPGDNNRSNAQRNDG